MRPSNRSSAATAQVWRAPPTTSTATARGRSSNRVPLGRRGRGRKSRRLYLTWPPGRGRPRDPQRRRLFRGDSLHWNAWPDLRWWAALLLVAAIAEPLRRLPGYRGNVVADRADF